MPSVDGSSTSSGPYSGPRMPAWSVRAGSINPSSSARRKTVPWFSGSPK